MLNPPAKPGPEQVLQNYPLLSEPTSPRRIMIDDLNTLIGHKPSLTAQ